VYVRRELRMGHHILLHHSYRYFVARLSEGMARFRASKAAVTSTSTRTESQAGQNGMRSERTTTRSNAADAFGGRLSGSRLERISRCIVDEILCDEEALGREETNRNGTDMNKQTERLSVFEHQIFMLSTRTLSPHPAKKARP